MKKTIAGVLVVLGMFLTPGATPYAPKTRAPIYESTWPGCSPLRSCGMFAHSCCLTTRVTAGVGGGGLDLWLRYQTPGKKTNKQPRAREQSKRVFMEFLEKEMKGFQEIHISEKNGPKPNNVLEQVNRKILSKGVFIYRERFRTRATIEVLQFFLRFFNLGA